MLMKRAVVAVVTADVVNSTGYSPQDRRKVDEIIRRAFTETSGRYPKAFETSLTFRITAGDEFQMVVADVGAALSVLTHLRAVAASGPVSPFVRFRASIGVGTISLGGRKSSYENDGEAFVRSRNGLEELARERAPVRWTKASTGHAEADRTLDALLCLLDYMQESWTVRQWEAVRWSLLGANRNDSAKRLKIRHQNVSKRLKAAGWAQFEVGIARVSEILGSAGTLKGVRSSLAS